MKIIKVTPENENNPNFQQAIETFRRQYPNITSGDLQSFTIGWQMREKQKNNNLPEYHEIQYHAKTLTADQFREYWKEIQNEQTTNNKQNEQI